jgi:hypothetical protein
MVGSDDSLETSTVDSTSASSTIKKVHKPSFPLKEMQSPTGNHAQVQLLQYTLDLSTISINLGSFFFLPRVLTWDI